MLIGNFKIKPLKETNLGMAHAFFFTPNRYKNLNIVELIFCVSSRAAISENLAAKNIGALPEPKSEIYTRKTSFPVYLSRVPTKNFA